MQPTRQSVSVKVKSHPVLDTLLVKPPEISIGEIREFAQEVFELEGDIELLGGERDRNFLFKSKEGDVLLKAANRGEPDSVLEMQCNALDHIEQYAPDLPVPRLIRTASGEPWANRSTSDGRDFRIRAFTYLPGKPVGQSPEDSGLMKNIGRMVAKIDLALRGFFHSSGNHPLAWNLQTMHQLRHLLEYMENPSEKRLVEKSMDQFAHSVQPVIGKLRAQIIHNDVSFHNTVTHPGRTADIAGIFDFGDMVFAPMIQDLAISAAEIPSGCHDPLARSSEIIAGYNEIIPLEDSEIALLPDLLAARLSLCLLIETWAIAETSWNDQRSHLDGWRQKCLNMLETIHSAGQGEVEHLIRSTCALPGSPVPEVRNSESYLIAMEKRQRYLGNADYISYDKPIHLSHGEGVWLFDCEGKWYLDAYNNVPHAGHCHPRITDAVAKQTAKLNTNTRYLYDIITRYAERLTDTLPAGLENCYFVSSGSEANDLALRLAKCCTGNKGVLILENAYHGITEAIDALSPAEGKNGKHNPDYVAEITAPDDFRGPWKRSNPHRGAGFAQYASDAIRVLKSGNFKPAALFMDMIMCSSGIFSPAPGYLESIFALVREAGGVCVADEVQSGFGRTGDHMWGFQAGDVVPDIVTLGKPVAGGYPMGVVITTREIANQFAQKTDFFSTTGGNPVACAAALAMLEVIETESLMDNARLTGARIISGIQELSDNYPVIGDVRGSGLFIGVELVRDQQTLEPASRETRQVVNLMRENGVLVGIDGIHGNVIKIRPPMVFNQTHADILLEELGNALQVLIRSG